MNSNSDHPRRIRLGVNVDHVATLRQARQTSYPDPVSAAAIAERAGADQITVHLRQDRRHIQRRDVEILRRTVDTRLNLEMAATAEMVDIAEAIEPDMVTLVPENRQEQTTEGGLAVVEHRGHLGGHIDRLRACGAHISLFIDPQADQVAASADLGVDIIELHTGDYCEASAAFTNTKAPGEFDRRRQFDRLVQAARLGADRDLIVAAGHGIDYQTAELIAAIDPIEEFNIGHSIVARAVLVGFDKAVRQMIDAMRR